MKGFTETSWKRLLKNNFIDTGLSSSQIQLNIQKGGKGNVLQYVSSKLQHFELHYLTSCSYVKWNEAK